MEGDINEGKGYQLPAVRDPVPLGLPGPSDILSLEHRKRTRNRSRQRTGWYVIWTLFLKKFKFVRELLGTNDSETDVTSDRARKSRGKSTPPSQVVVIIQETVMETFTRKTSRDTTI
ncbi:hypothetical protein MAR_026292 [Mya arenaria]|uniref:Uncharacterized protein n=1 Tax=Mya arenaria TaxID=6604 RepID=A0ABY7EQ56_MYAAR|nr:hypothetical protein MAR_026292 [Mya arenaria]